MITRIRPFLICVLAVVCLGSPSQAAPRAEHVFVISFDQAAPAGINRANMPLFKAMAAEGAHTWEAYTIVPSITLPSHVSMLTGVGIQKHQILWNEWDETRPKLAVPTIFHLAKAKGLSTAMIAAKNKFRTFEQAGGLDTFLIPEDAKAKDIGAAVADLLKTKQPNLIFIHFADPDTTGHQYGVDSAEKMQALADCDQALGVIRAAIAAAGIADKSVMILTADHGGHDRPAAEIAERIKRGQPPSPGTHGLPDSSDVIIPWIAWGKGVKPGFTVTAPVVQYDTAATALWLLDVPVPESFWGRPVVSAFE
ncbi:alkaline phosphatase family protein [Rariglobus hedericola]|uniref:Sulfatase-like hydrolase/transferase n=1 Tax=Rariglobus hedericola TaxID=2597822 RepID=A0A556QKF6_9BACT|nr:alkaline phosphatase family protein [Rariglobus hedericola]TSJ77126.1 sulfatase-like hydrolase/transferase [Rariglobus hedericola]